MEVHSVDMNAANQLVALEDAAVALGPAMAAYQRKHRAYIFQIALNVVFHKAVDTTILTDPPVTLRATMAAVYPSELPQLVETSRNLLELLEVYEQNGSRWVFSNVVSMELTVWHLDPLRASAFVPLPKWIRDRRAVTNVVGTGDDCFKWAVLVGLHPAVDNPSRMENYLPYVNLYDFSNLNYPVPLSSIAPFTKKNNISINVYAVEDGKRIIFPLCVTDKPVDGKHVDLLMHESNEIQHYSTIRNFSRLVSGQHSSHEHSVYSCKKCLHACTSAAVLERHMERCTHVQLAKFPKDPRCRFTNIQKQLPAPFVVYADFESVLKPLSDMDTTQGVEEGGEPPIVPYQKHVACSFSYKIVSSVISDFYKPVVWYRGEGAADEFVRVLQREAEELCADYIETPQEMKFSVDDEVHFECAHKCATFVSKLLRTIMIVSEIIAILLVYTVVLPIMHATLITVSAQRVGNCCYYS